MVGQNSLRTLVCTLVLIVVLGNLLCIDICCAAQATIYVDDSNTAGPWDGTLEHPYKTIQQAITLASAGDLISISSGTYMENIVITKDLRILGENKDTTVIDGGALGHVLTAYGSTSSLIQVDISQLTLRNAGGSGFDCITYSYVANAEIAHNKILNSQEGEGISLDHCQSITIHDNVITSCKVTGISITLSDENIIQTNIIQNNQKGLHLAYSTNNQILSNTIRENTIYGLYVFQSSNNIFSFNDILSNGQNAQDSSTNSWSSNGQGNYWSDYNKYDNNSDGIGDESYAIPGGNNHDDFPLGYFKVAEQQGSENQRPTALSLSISKNPAYFGETITFIGEGIDSDGFIIGYSWRSSRDGLLSSQQTYSSSTLSIGTHTIYFKVKDNNDVWSVEKTSTITINSPINEIPMAFIDSITPNPAPYRDAVLFQGHGSDKDGEILAYKWISNKDGVLGTSSSFSLTTLSVGTHTIYFQVKDSTEWSSQVTQTVVIQQNTSSGNSENLAPVANIGGPYSGSINREISFNGSGSYDHEGEISFLWDFGDNTTGSSPTPTHVYTTPGTYTVTLTVHDEGGLMTIAATSVIISQAQTNGNNPEGSFLSDVEIPFPIIIVIIFVCIISVIILFIVKMKHG